MKLKDGKLYLSAKEIEDIVYELDNPDVENVDKVEDILYVKTYRWRSLIETIVKYENKYYSVSWQKGSTEDCDDYFEDKICNEVEKVIVEKYEWRGVEKNG